jgi:hypothetical protein
MRTGKPRPRPARPNTPHARPELPLNVGGLGAAEPMLVAGKPVITLVE